MQGAEKKDPDLTKVRNEPPEDHNDENLKLKNEDLENEIEGKEPHIISEDPSTKITKCKHCNYSFENIKKCINTTIMAVHLKIKHPENKKGFKRFIYKMKKKGLINISQRFIKPSNDRFIQRTNLRTRSPQPSQDSETSQKSPKRVRNKQEYIRPGAILPDNIRLKNYISCS